MNDDHKETTAKEKTDYKFAIDLGTQEDAQRSLENFSQTIKSWKQRP